MISRLLRNAIGILCYLFIKQAIAQTACDLPTVLSGNILFVTEHGAGMGNGTTWENALDGRLLAKYLRDSARDGMAIYVAQGTYYPFLQGCDDAVTKRQYSFMLN